MLLLYRIQSFFGVGNVYIDKTSDMASYQVKSITDLANVIIPHFDKYPLITQKYADFLIFKSIIQSMLEKEHTRIEGIQKIVNNRASMNSGLSDCLKAAFPNTILVSRSEVKYPEIKDPNWFAGFSAGESCFSVVISKSKTIKTGHGVNLRFGIGQHSRDLELINSLIQYLGCGQITKKRDKEFVEYNVGKFSDINEKIIPFFSKYPFLLSLSYSQIYL